MFLIWSFESVGIISFWPVADTNERAGTDFGATSSLIVTLVGFFPPAFTALTFGFTSALAAPSGLTITGFGADGFPACFFAGFAVVFDDCLTVAVGAGEEPGFPCVDRLKTSWPELVLSLCSGYG